MVEKNGSLSGIKVLRGLGYGTEEEAVRVIKNSPKWKPGIAKGEAVRVQYTIPVSFNLAKNYDSKTLSPTALPDALYLVDGHETRIEDAIISPASIKSVNVLKGDAATEKYGRTGYKAIVEITTITRVGKEQF